MIGIGALLAPSGALADSPIAIALHVSAQAVGRSVQAAMLAGMGRPA
jgi:hypothetical protein